MSMPDSYVAPHPTSEGHEEPIFASEVSAREKRDPTTIAVVTGIGGVGPLGCDNGAAYAAARDGIQLFEPVRYFDASSFQCRRAFHVASDYAALEAASLTDFERGFGAAARFSIVAAKLALADANLQRLDPDLTPIFIGSTINDLAATGSQLQRLPEMLTSDVSDRVDPNILQLVTMHLPAVAVANSLGLEGHTGAWSTACATPGSLLSLAASKIRARDADSRVILVGGAEAPINPIVFNVFSKNGLVTSADRVSIMDAKSSGTGLSEGAVVFVVESLHNAITRGARPIFEIESVGLVQNSVQNPDRHGRLVARAGEIALADDKRVDLVIMHAPGFAPLEVIEARGQRLLFGDNMPPHTGQKACYGGGGAYHTAESIRLAAMMMERNEALHTPNCDEPARHADALNLIRHEPRRLSLNRIAINFAGLLGSLGTLVIRRPTSG